MEPDYTSEYGSSSASIYRTKGNILSLQSEIVISDSSSSDSQHDRIYSSRARHRLPTQNAHRGTIGTPRITPLAWDIEYARRMQQGRPSTWLHRLVDWTAERVQVSFEASNPINEEYASDVRHERYRETA